MKDLTRQDIADLVELANLGCRTRRDKEFLQEIMQTIQDMWNTADKAPKVKENTNGVPEGEPFHAG